MEPQDHRLEECDQQRRIFYGTFSGGRMPGVLIIEYGASEGLTGQSKKNTGENSLLPVLISPLSPKLSRINFILDVGFCSQRQCCYAQGKRRWTTKLPPSAIDVCLGTKKPRVRKEAG